MDITTITDDSVVVHDGERVERHVGLAPDTVHTLGGAASGTTVRTLPRPPGELLCRFTTVNDVHFGEVEAGRLDEHSTGPVRRVPDGAEPYPEVMNRTAVAEMLALEPDAVIVKGDLSVDGNRRNGRHSRRAIASRSATDSMWCAVTMTATTTKMPTPATRPSTCPG